LQTQPQISARWPKSKGRTTQRIDRAHAINGFVADRPLAIEPITNPALAMKNSSDTALHRIIVAMIAAAESDLVACRLNRNVKGDQQRDKNEIGDVPAADEGGSFLDAVCGIPSSV
jgi:hypothetical protein